MWLKQSTSATIKLGPFVDSTDGVTAETALTIQKADVRLSKNGGDMAAASADQGASDAGAAHDELGYYDISLNATDTGTLGRLRVMVSESGALPVWRDFLVVPANVYDSLVAGSDTLQGDVTQWTGTNVATPDTAGYPKVTVKSGTGTGEVSVTSGVVAANATQISGDATAADNLEAALDGTGGVTITAGLTGDITGNLSGSVGSVTGAVGSVTGNVGGNVTGSVGSVTGNVGGNVTGSVGSLALQAKADVNAEVDTAISDAALATAAALATVDANVDAILVDTGTDIPATLSTIAGYIDTEVAAILVDTGTTIPGTLSTIAGYIDTEIAAIKAVTDKLDDTLEDDAGTYRFTTNALEQAPSGSGLALADAVPDPGTSGTVGEALRKVLDNLDVAVSSVEGAAGSGAVSWPINILDGDSNPILDCEVWVTTDEAGASVVAGTLETDGNGQVTFLLDTGTYWCWRQKAGVTFADNPKQFTVTA